jgi:NDP-sugar pyrophosphorylase family protein
MLRATDFFDTAGIDIGRPLESYETVWEILPDLPQLIEDLLGGKRIIKGEVSPMAVVDDGPVFIAEGATIEPGAYVKGPAYIGPSAVVRHGAYVRESVMLLDGSLLGHASEAKNALLLPAAKAPHFAYVGDSVLGRRVNLGAGVVLSNMPIASRSPSGGGRPTIVIEVDGEKRDTGLRKLGGILGDGVQIGCNSVLNPGVLIGPRSVVYPNTNVRKGCYKADTMLKLRQVIEPAERH